MKRPAVTAAVLWTTGCAAAAGGLRVPFAGFISLLLLAVVLLLWRMKAKGRVVLLGAALITGGIFYYSWHDDRNVSEIPMDSRNWEAADNGAPVFLDGVIDTLVEVDGDRAMFNMQVHTWRWKEGGGIQVKEKVRVTLRLLRQSEQKIVESWRRGDHLRLEGTALLPESAGNFGGFDYRSYLRRQGIHWLVTSKGTASAKLSPPAGWDVRRLLQWNDRLREKMAVTLERLFPPEEAGYMKGLLIGIREDLDPVRFRQFSGLGLTHILAISGLHVAVFTGILNWIMRRLGMTRETALVVTFWTIPLYIAFTGASPSVVRAGLTAMAAAEAARRNMLKDGLQLLGGAAVLMLIWNPYYVLDVSFQLSFLVTAGLIIGVPIVGRLLPIRQKFMNSAIAVALTAQWVSFPLTIHYFNQFSFLSFPANLLLVPLISFVVTPLGSAAMIAGVVWPAGGSAIAILPSFINRISFQTVEWLEAIPGFKSIWPSPSIGWIIVYYLLSGSLLLLLKRRMELRALEREGIHFIADGPIQIRRYAWTAVFMTAILAAMCFYAYSPDRWWNRGTGLVAYLDVGQGDSAYVRTPGGKHLLIDGGGTFFFGKPGEEWKKRKDPYEVGRKTIVPLLKERGVHRLDFVIISHEDTDHIGGLQAVLEELPVGVLLINGTLKKGETSEKLFRTALSKHIPIVTPEAGDEIKLDSRTSIRILAPLGQAGKVAVQDDQNPYTLVFDLQMLSSRFLFTGDMGSDTEKTLLDAWGASPPSSAPSSIKEYRIDVLKVAHHGSKNSTSSAWLSYWQPRLSVISVGAKNVYGHPNPAALERLKTAGSTILRTDRQGEVQVLVKPSGLWVRTKKNAD